MAGSSGHPATPTQSHVQVAEDSTKPQFCVLSEPLYRRPSGIVLAVHVQDGPQVARRFALDAQDNLVGHGHGDRLSGPPGRSNGTLMARKIDNRPGTVETRASDPHLTCGCIMERVTRIELALSAWEADVLPLNYTRTGRAAGRAAVASPRHRTGTGRLRACCSPTETSAARSSPAGSGSIRTRPNLSSRPASTSGWTGTSGSSRTTGTRTSTRRQNSPT